MRKPQDWHSQRRLLWRVAKRDRPLCPLRLRTLSRRRARWRATFQMSRVAVLLPESFRGGCSFGAGLLRCQSLPTTRQRYDMEHSRSSFIAKRLEKDLFKDERWKS